MNTDSLLVRLGAPVKTVLMIARDMALTIQKHIADEDYGHAATEAYYLACYLDRERYTGELPWSYAMKVKHAVEASNFGQARKALDELLHSLGTDSRAATDLARPAGNR